MLRMEKNEVFFYITQHCFFFHICPAPSFACGDFVLYFRMVGGQIYNWNSCLQTGFYCTSLGSHDL